MTVRHWFLIAALAVLTSTVALAQPQPVISANQSQPPAESVPGFSCPRPGCPGGCHRKR